MKLKKIAAGILCAALMITPCGCKKAAKLIEDDTPPVSAAYKTAELNNDGTLEITRKDIGSTPMGEEGTWTIFVYMNGTDLEPYGTKDLDEMLAASTGKNVRFIVQTGGAVLWQNDYVNADMLERYEISNGKRKNPAEVPLASMGEASTLRNFLKWGVENYPAEKMGVVFWGHGQGTVGGVGNDKIFEDAPRLSLDEINSAFAEVSAIMTDKFEFVGFDMCHMGTVETADMIAAYARYMIGSEELAPAKGWNFTALGDLLGSDPDADWSEIAKNICDNFFIDNEGATKEPIVTIAVIDLSKIDELSVRFNDYARELYAAFADKDKQRGFERALGLTDHFGYHDLLKGYTNMADLADLVEAGSAYASGADKVLKAIDDAVIYKRTGAEHPSACGLTICYPFMPSGSDDMRIIGKTAISPYYLALLDRKLRETAAAADMAHYDENAVIRLWCENTKSPGVLDEYWKKSLGQYKNERGISPLLKQVGEFKPDYSGAYSIKLTPESLPYVASVGINVYASKPKHWYYDLGTLICAEPDLENGVFSDKFDGRWIMLPNRDPISIRFLETVGGSGYYVSQLTANEAAIGVELSFDPENSAVTLGGFRKPNGDGTSRFEQPARGETLSAHYPIYTYYNIPFTTTTGEEYTVDGGQTLIYDVLPDGDYYYMIVVTDIWGDRLQSDIADFTIKNGKIVPYVPAPENAQLTRSN